MADECLRYPFTVVGGSVATTTQDAEALRSKILFCLGTQINERVMRPQWGVDIMSTIYSVGGDLEDAVPEAIKMAFQKWFPTIRLVETRIVQDPQRPNWATVTVRFGKIDSTIDEVVRLDLPLDEGEV